MKKKFLLAIIPALMTISACAGANAAPKAEPNLFLEDNLAHEEFFGESENVSELGLAQPHRLSGDIDYEPAIGVQFKTYKKEYKGEDRDYCAIRYVAAIESTHVKAEWIRAVSMQDSTVLKSKGAKESLLAYSALNNNGTVLKAVEGTKFVVYSLIDIPLFEYLNADPEEADVLNCNWSYVAAGLKLSDLDNPSNFNMSKIVAVEIGNHHCFSFDEDDLTDTGYFIEGKIDGANNQVVALDGNVSGSTNHAKKTLDLDAGDKFGVFKWSESEFKFFGNFNHSYDKHYISLNEALSTNYSLVGKDAEYTLYVNGEDRFGLDPTTPLSIPTTIYLDLNGTVWDVEQANAYKIAVWQTSLNTWVTPTSVTSKVYKFDFVDTANAFIFVQYSNSDADPNWNWGAACQTNNLTYNDANVFIMNDTYSITGWTNGGDGHAGVARSTSIE